MLLTVIVILRALFGGAAGYWSLLLVAAAAVGLWAAVRVYRRARALFAQAHPEAVEWIESSRFAAVMTRSRSRLAAVLALLILIVHAAITGYVGVWTILVAIVLGAIATLLSPDLRLVALLGGMAVIFGRFGTFSTCTTAKPSAVRTGPTRPATGNSGTRARWTRP